MDTLVRRVSVVLRFEKAASAEIIDRNAGLISPQFACINAGPKVGLTRARKVAWFCINITEDDILLLSRVRVEGTVRSRAQWARRRDR